MDASELDQEIAYRRIHGLEARMPGSARRTPRCCAWLVRCFRCFNGESDNSQNTMPRSRAMENHLYQYEAPQSPVASAPVAQPHRQAPVYVDDVDAGPLLPKTAESSAPLPRLTHSRNNSSASATAAAATSTSFQNSEPLALSSKRTSCAEGPSAQGAAVDTSRASHRRTCSYGDGRPRKPPKGEGPGGSAAAALVAAEASAAALGPGVTATSSGRAGAAFAHLQDEDDDFCPTCLEAYSSDNPKIFTECGHHFHMPCIYAWLERKDTCPMCASPMHAPGV